MAKKQALRGFVFYSQDYFGDVAVRLMPANLRLVWIEAFLLMDQSPRRGVLLKKNGDPFSVAELATTMNTSAEDVKAAFEWVIREGIASTDRRTKTLINRRMVREENRRKVNEKNGKKGGNPSLLRVHTGGNVKDLLNSVNRTANHQVKAKPEPEPDPKPDIIGTKTSLDNVPSGTGATKYPDTFEAFWAGSTRRGSKLEAFQVWQKIRPSPELQTAMSLGMAAWRQSEQWQDETKQPHVCRWIRRRGWEEIIPRSNGNGAAKESNADRIARENRETKALFDSGLPDATGNGDRPEGHTGARRALLSGAE